MSRGAPRLAAVAVLLLAAVMLVVVIASMTGLVPVESRSAGSASPSLRSTSTGRYRASPSSLVVPRPAGVTGGDVLIAAVAARVGSAASLTAPAGWTLVRRDDCSGPQRTELAQALFYKAAGSSEPSAYTFSFSEVTGAAGAVLAYTGVDPASPIDGSSGRFTRNTGGIYAPSLIPTGEGRRLLVAFAHSGPRGIPAPAGTTQRAEAMATAAQAVTLAVFDEALGSSAPTGDRSSRGPAPRACSLGGGVLLRPAGSAPSARPTTSPPSPTPPPPSPAPPSPPPPPPPPPAEGTTLTFTDTTWTCDRPVAQLATHGLPLRVVMNYTHNYEGFGVRLAPGCSGDGTSAIDLVLNVNGDGLTRGPQHDAIRVLNRLPGASNLQITGYANCGRNRNQDLYHQDGIQVLGGTNITWFDFEVGDYDAGRSTCQGAGGAFFYSLPSVNTRVQGGKYIACNHSLAVYPGVGSGSVSGASFRSGRNDGTDPACDYHSSDPCSFQPSVARGPGVSCQRWNPTSDRWEDQ